MTKRSYDVRRHIDGTSPGRFIRSSFFVRWQPLFKEYVAAPSYLPHESTGLPHAYPCYLQMDETVVNGAQLFFPQQFGISTDPAVAGSASKANQNEWILGLVTGAPYVRPRHLRKGISLESN